VSSARACCRHGAAQPGAWVLFLCTELCGLPSGDGRQQGNIIAQRFSATRRAVLVRSGDADSAHRGLGGTPGRGTPTSWAGRWPTYGLGVSSRAASDPRARTYARGDRCFSGNHGLTQADLAGLIVHPGGEKVLAALEECYGLANGELNDAREVAGRARQYVGVTALAFWKRLSRAAPRRHLMTALGPGSRSACVCSSFCNLGTALLVRRRRAPAGTRISRAIPNASKSAGHGSRAAHIRSWWRCT